MHTRISAQEVTRADMCVKVGSRFARISSYRGQLWRITFRPITLLITILLISKHRGKWAHILFRKAYSACALRGVYCRVANDLMHVKW